MRVGHLRRHVECEVQIIIDGVLTQLDQISLSRRARFEFLIQQNRFKHRISTLAHIFNHEFDTVLHAQLQR